MFVFKFFTAVKTNTAISYYDEGYMSSLYKARLSVILMRRYLFAFQLIHVHENMQGRQLLR